jgi:hypothetical protein
MCLGKFEIVRAIEERDADADASVWPSSAAVLRPAFGPAKSRGAGPTALARGLGDTRLLRGEHRMGFQYESNGIADGIEARAARQGWRVCGLIKRAAE